MRLLQIIFAKLKKATMPTCPTCKTKFTARVGGKPQRHCSPACRKAAYRARTAGSRATSQRPADAEQPSNVAARPEVEWLGIYPDLHRCVAGRLNPARDGKSVPRDDAIGMDRPPIGHAIHADDGWHGKVRSNGAVVWESEGFANLESAKAIVERRLAELPEVVASAVAALRGAGVSIAA
jgi:hypothetical protein